MSLPGSFPFEHKEPKGNNLGFQMNPASSSTGPSSRTNQAISKNPPPCEATSKEATASIAKVLSPPNKSQPLSCHRSTPLDPDTPITTDIASPVYAIPFLGGRTQDVGLLYGWGRFAEEKLHEWEQDGGFKRRVARLLSAILTLFTLCTVVLDWSRWFGRGKRKHYTIVHALAGRDDGDQSPGAIQPTSTTDISQQAPLEMVPNSTDHIEARAATSLDSDDNTRILMRRSGHRVSRQMLVDGSVGKDKLLLNPEAASVPGPSTETVPEAFKFRQKSVKRKGLFDNKTKPLRIRMPKNRPTLLLERDLERQRQCLAQFMDSKGQWHLCHVLFDTWCDRDLISTALVQGLIDQEDIEEWHVPDGAVETVQNFFDSRLFALKSYVQIPAFRFEHRRTEIIENQEFYIITNETPFIIFSHTSMYKHGIRLNNLPEDESSSSLNFANLQFNVGVVKFKKGKQAKKEDEKHEVESRTKHADTLKIMQEDKDAETGSSTSTQTTSTEDTGCSSAATSSQDGSHPNGH